MKAQASARNLLVVFALLAALPATSTAGERYASAVVDATGELRIRTTDGRAIAIAKEAEQVGFDKIAISPDGTAVGWLRLFANCCTSYPIPLHLDIYANGKSRRLTSVQTPVWNWCFTRDSRRVAFHQETTHGALGIHYELHDVASGAMLAEWNPVYGQDNRVLEKQNPPAWVRELDQSK